MKNIESVDSGHLNKSMKNVIVSCVLGGAIEWYSFAIYGFLTTIIGKKFFPSATEIQVAIATLGAFAVGLLSRPIGAVFFGYVGDKFGQKKAFSLSIYMMAIPTFLIGCLPTYEQIGTFATILLMLLRVIQGLALGGGFTGTMVFLYEKSPKNEKGKYTAWSSFCLVAGFLLCAIVSTIVSLLFSKETLSDYAWRFPFMLGISGIFVADIVNKKLQESKKAVTSVQDTPDPKKSSLMKELFGVNCKNLFLAILSDILTGCGFFLIAIFFTTYFETILHLSHETSSIIQMINLAIFGITILYFGRLSDRIGYIKQMKIGCIIMAIFAYPIFMFGSTGGIANAALCQLGIILIFSTYNGVIANLLCELFPTRVRLLGVSVAHNLAMAAFGAYTPSVATILIQKTGDLAIPGVILIFAALATFIGLYLSQKKIYNQH